LPDAPADGESHPGARGGGLSHGIHAWCWVAASAEDYAGATGRPGGEDAPGAKAGGNQGTTEERGSAEFYVTLLTVFIGLAAIGVIVFVLRRFRR